MSQFGYESLNAPCLLAPTMLSGLAYAHPTDQPPASLKA
jgi:hypothetical protein